MRIALALVVILTASAVILFPPPAAAATQNDAGTGGDAGNAFGAATLIPSFGTFNGRFDPSIGDTEDFYRFFVAQGEPLDVEVYAGLNSGSIQVNDANRRLGIKLLDPNGVLLDTPVSSVGDYRVSFAMAPISGEYRLQLTHQTASPAGAAYVGPTSYGFCFAITSGACERMDLHPIALASPLPSTHANVLLVPPPHGNPLGSETALTYLQATLDGINAWEPAIDAFVAKYPQYAYLDRLTIHVEVFDGDAPKRAGYDVVVVWSPYTGPIFRGLAVTTFAVPPSYTAGCIGSPGCANYYTKLEPVLHDSSRLIVMSMFAAAPRAGQTMPDWPEAVDVQNVAQHEFAHTWGLGHSTTWLAATGPDLMNSPYGFVFGDGDPLSDGGERSPHMCVSSLDLYGLALLYEWVGRGVGFGQRFNYNSATLPTGVNGIPYELYC